MWWPFRAVRRRVLAVLGRMGPLGRALVLGEEMGFGRLLTMIELVEGTYGHSRSVRRGAPVDREGNPLPWFTYPAIEYLSQLDLAGCAVFEYGAGLGSLFFAGRAASLTSVESDSQWASVVRASSPPNHQLLERPEGVDYVRAIHHENRPYDVVIVDGMNRRDCAAEALKVLKEDGFLILDNSDWHPETARMLREAGLVQVDFSGLGPGNLYTWTTSLFLRRSVRLVPREGRQPHYSLGAVRQVAETDQPLRT